MSLDNLVKTGQLKKHAPAPDEIRRLLRSIERNIADSRVATISAEARFDCAYRAIMQCALLALAAAGYRPSTSVPGHQQTMIQTLPQSMAISADVVLVLDALRRKRNLPTMSAKASTRNPCASVLRRPRCYRAMRWRGSSSTMATCWCLNGSLVEN